MRARPKSPNFPKAAAPKAGKSGHTNFQGGRTRPQAFTEKWDGVFPTFTSFTSFYIWILVMFVGADTFLEFFLDLQFLSTLLLYFWNTIRSTVLRRFCAKMLFRPQVSTLCIVLCLMHSTVYHSKLVIHQCKLQHYHSFVLWGELNHLAA